MRFRLLGATAILCALGACQTGYVVSEPSVQSEAIERGDEVSIVDNQDAYFAAAETARPGDVIVLADGVWQDFDMLLHAEGTSQAPITVRAQTPGKVILSGQSSLRLAGQHLVVSGLVFRDGYTPRAELISFRRDSENLAFSSRVTETVIDNFSNPDRRQRDLWVAIYGQNNVFDHNHMSGKNNSGPTLAVRLNSEDSQDNNHVIDSNYFGPRPVFGSNGGETLRIGTSHFSLTRSGTQVTNNYFDRCSGEVEIISSKSGENVFRGNTFFQSRGTLTLRHGNGTLIENNLFDGDGAPYTGGVRVINAHHTVRNNRFTNLTGERFSGALVVMNGVPNSPINRYHQVDGVTIENNTFDTIRRIELGEGSDSERSAVPINSRFQNNIVLGESDDTPFRLYDDMSGIDFSGNIADAAPPSDIAGGFQVSSARDVVNSDAGAVGDFGVARDATGVDWYPKAPITSPFEGGQTVTVTPGESALSNAIKSAGPGDTLLLAPGTYAEPVLVNLHIPISIVAAESETAPVITFERPNFFLLSGEGGLRMSGITVSGANSPDSRGNAFISTSSSGGAGNHTVQLTDMNFVDFDVNRGFSVVSAAKGHFFDRIEIIRSSFSDVSGAVVKLDAETDDNGIYNSEYLIIEDSQFERIGGPVAAVYRGGRDESTFGPHVWVNGSSFDGIGLTGGPLMQLHGVQNLKLTGNRVANAEPADFVITTGKPKTDVSGNTLVRPGASAVLTTTDLRN
ncbi:MAG: chondroitinase-B domain-containing protein [Pseudomonadota bacterium]